MNYASYEDVLQIVEGVAKKIPQGLMQGNVPVGMITWQYVVMEDYLALDGATINDASIQYPELLSFAKVHSLITTDTTKTYLFQYDETNDVLTMPDFMDKGLWSGSTVEEKEAGLPNIKGYINTFSWSTGLKFIIGDGNLFNGVDNTNNATVSPSGVSGAGANINFNANNYNPIYSDSVTTVQPPAIQLIPQIKYRNSTSVFDTVTIGRYTATAPDYYRRGELPTPNRTSITIHRTWVNVDDIGYVLENDKTMYLDNVNNWDDGQYATASNRVGKDFYVYAVVNSTANIEPDFILSANSTIPNGYTANTSRKIGGFHCLCRDVGTISGHTLSGYVAGDILPLSVWDLSHRAVSENEGMVYIPPIGMWGDIYLGSWNGTNLVSKYNQVCVTGESAKKMHGLMFAEEYGLVNKRLPSYDEFIVWAKGTPEGSHISTDAVSTGAGGHVDKSNRRIISNYGLEDCCGVLWQWTRNYAEHYGTSGNNTSYWNGNNDSYFLVGYAWQDVSVYNSTVDTVKRGSSWGLLRQLRVGGSYDDGVARVGSRCVDTFSFGTYLYSIVGGRGFSAER